MEMNIGHAVQRGEKQVLCLYSPDTKTQDRIYFLPLRLCPHCFLLISSVSVVHLVIVQSA